ncbi:22996_t:CDS:1, partial [Cetraspora pellucida]
VVGKDFALQNESMKITNTLRYCADHLKGCSYFATKHSSEQIQNIINLAISSTSKKCVAVFYAKNDNDDNSISTTLTHFTNLLFASNDTLSFLKKQTMLSQYVGQLLNTSEVSKFECLVF